MRRSALVRPVFAAIMLAAVSAYGQSYKAESVPAPAASDLPAKVAAVLKPQGARLVDAQGKAVAEVWLRKSLAAQAQPDAAMDVLYGALPPGTMVGVLHFPAAGSDFRGQAIPPGYYTLRYELVPQDGNHMGVSAYRDFLLLIPAAQGSDPDRAMKFDEAVQLSRKAAGTGHPAVMVMDPPKSPETQSPAAFQDDMQNWALEEKTELAQPDGKTKSYPLAVVLVGKYQG